MEEIMRALETQSEAIQAISQQVHQNKQQQEELARQEAITAR